MPRYPTQSSLPPLEKVLPGFTSLCSSRSKVQQVADLLKEAVKHHRSASNLTFYSTRYVGLFFGVSQNTAAWAIRRLESEGLLRRVRGSQVLLLGSEKIGRSHIHAVAGLLIWNFAQRYSEVHNILAGLLAEHLWRHHIALEIIPHYDIGDNRPCLDDRLKGHALDFAIWPFPFSHHKEHMLRLEDRGIRNLIVGVNGVSTSYRPQIIIDITSPYTEILQIWYAEGIRRVLVIQPREFPPRERLKLFVKIALEMGFDCQLELSDYSLTKELLKRERRRIGIALLDEHSTAEFSFYDPSVFVKLARRHRVLFGNGYIHLPFVPDGELLVDRIFIPRPGHPGLKMVLVTAIAKTIVEWAAGNLDTPPITLPALVWPEGELWRYL